MFVVVLHDGDLTNEPGVRVFPTVEQAKVFAWDMLENYDHVWVAPDEDFVSG